MNDDVGGAGNVAADVTGAETGQQIVLAARIGADVEVDRFAFVEIGDRLRVNGRGETRERRDRRDGERTNNVAMNHNLPPR